MPKVRVSQMWWKWGENEKRKSLTEYPKFKNFVETNWGKQFDEKLQIKNDFEIITDEARVEKVSGIFSKDLPAIRCSNDPAVRLQKTLGKSYPDWLSAVTGAGIEIPDLVVFPKNHDEVSGILQVADANGILIFPFGGGTNVVGAFKIPFRKERPYIAIDLGDMDKLLSLDAENCMATFQTGILGPALEKILNERGFTLGHFPQSFEFSSLGGWIATRSAGQESSTYGRIEDIAVSLKVATPSGTFGTSNYEGDAEGINLKHMIFGSEGTLGVVTEAKLRIHHLPESKEWVVALFPQFQNGVDALRKLIQAGVYPSVVRYSDERETFFLSLMSHEQPSLVSNIKASLTKFILNWKNLHHPCLLMVRMDGGHNDTTERKNRAGEIFKAHQGFLVGESFGKKWEKSRFGLPYLRDDLMERGIFIDTMETVFPWTKVDEVRKKLHAALLGSEEFGKEKGVLLSHISHVYDSCASIYFTVITKQQKGKELEQWSSIKTLVMDTIAANGGAVSHHHSIGTDHRKWYLKNTDALTKKILQSVKKVVDPNHILNPGKLFDE